MEMSIWPGGSDDDRTSLGRAGGLGMGGFVMGGNVTTSTEVATLEEAVIGIWDVFQPRELMLTPAELEKRLREDPDMTTPIGLSDRLSLMEGGTARLPARSWQGNWTLGTTSEGAARLTIHVGNVRFPSTTYVFRGLLVDSTHPMVAMGSVLNQDKGVVVMGRATERVHDKVDDVTDVRELGDWFMTKKYSKDEFSPDQLYLLVSPTTGVSEGGVNLDAGADTSIRAQFERLKQEKPELLKIDLEAHSRARDRQMSPEEAAAIEAKVEEITKELDRMNSEQQPQTGPSSQSEPSQTELDQLFAELADSMPPLIPPERLQQAENKAFEAMQRSLPSLPDLARFVQPEMLEEQAKEMGLPDADRLDYKKLKHFMSLPEMANVEAAVLNATADMTTRRRRQQLQDDAESDSTPVEHVGVSERVLRNLGYGLRPSSSEGEGGRHDDIDDGLRDGMSVEETSRVLAKRRMEELRRRPFGEPYVPPPDTGQADR
ncbi:unnamed protein product [Vitrella brassicaformis CCMP3155]|uniref:Uncharacterized protein n=1 Tax=Vitrella brassicaformis (strain CCMP3155) TaxID=1169540 RepID=A0A0G4EVA2_VITBC|nr:unnamed protein product [Vitrella brassicaformis CCMP3155]|eukprot:CEM02321.1 unnamed protein product [Vitrella brassicaformis CCMP3155]